MLPALSKAVALEEALTLECLDFIVLCVCGRYFTISEVSHLPGKLEEIPLEIRTYFEHDRLSPPFTEMRAHL